MIVRHALTELRKHPARLVATLAAIAISVGFMVATQVFVSSESAALAKERTARFTRADLVVSTAEGQLTPDQLSALRSALSAVPGVQAVDPGWATWLSAEAGANAIYGELDSIPGDPALRWFMLDAGRLPQGKAEFATSKATADALGIRLGSQVRANGAAMTLVGMVSGASRFTHTFYVSPAAFAGTQPDGFLVKTSDAAAARPALIAAAAKYGRSIEVQTPLELRRQALTFSAANFDVARAMLTTFAAIALLVGGIIIATTFAIIVSQRRRQLALLRLVGASAGQVGAGLTVEAFAIGLAGGVGGAVLGLLTAAIAGTVTGSIVWGLEVPWLAIAGCVLAGVIVTLGAAIVPILRAMRLAPMAALNPVESEPERRRHNALRAVVCGAFVLAGAALAAFSMTIEQALLPAVVAGALISIGVLAGSPLFVPVLLAGLSHFSTRGGPVVRMAVANCRRNPGRAAATVTALMLAVGLVVTLQVGTATSKASMLLALDQRFPVDVAVSGQGVGEVYDRLSLAPGVAAAVELRGAPTELKAPNGELWPIRALAATPDLARVLPTAVEAIPNDTVLVSPQIAASLPARSKVTIKGPLGSQTLAFRSSYLANSECGLLSEKTFAAVFGAQGVTDVWLSVPNRSESAKTIKAVREAIGTRPLQIQGAAVEASALEDVMNQLLAITMGLLGVAVLIAVLGVGNTLGLSVLERARESALLRALGLQRSHLRWMLAAEALALALVGVVVGAAAGVFFGWLGSAALIHQLGREAVLFTMDWPLTLATVAATVVAGALASVLPGRRAARAAPTQALAEA